jgi:hypothetical protein
MPASKKFDARQKKVACQLPKSCVRVKKKFGVNFQKVVCASSFSEQKLSRH